MGASGGDASPRGLEFLFDRNRMNAAMALAVVVGNPGLAGTGCSTVEQMVLVNAFCRDVGERSTEHVTS